MKWVLLYVTLSFVQALIVARGVNKMNPIQFPKTTVAAYTLFGPGVTLVLLIGVLSGFIERFVKGK